MLLWKPYQGALDYSSILPEGAVITRESCFPKSLGQLESMRRVVRAAQLRSELGCARVSNMTYAVERTANVEAVVDAVLEMTTKAFETQVIKAKMVKAPLRTDYQQTLAAAYPHLQRIRFDHAEAKRTQGLAGVVLAATALRYPTAFRTEVLGKMRGTVWSASSRECRQVTLEEYMNTPLHLTASCVMCGDPGWGKTPLLYAMCQQSYPQGCDRKC